MVETNWGGAHAAGHYMFWMSWSVDSISSCRSLFFSLCASKSSVKCAEDGNKQNTHD